MSKWHYLLLISSFITAATCDPYLLISRIEETGYFTATHTIIGTVGSKLTLICYMQGIDNLGSNTVVWGRRSSTLRFENVADLKALAMNNSQQLLDLNNTQDNSHEINKAYKIFDPLELTDRGTYFCMNLEHMLFKIIRIKVKEKKLPLKCTEEQFKCDNGEKCIGKQQVCDDIFQCTDQSDEKLCKHDDDDDDSCIDGIPCGDKCIPSKWCCNKKTDYDCFIDLRHICCPPLPDDEGNSYLDHKDVTTPTDYSHKTTNHIILGIATAVVVLTVILITYFGIKECGPREQQNSNNQNGMTLPPIIRTDDNDNSVILTALMNIGDSQEYLDLPPTYADSTRNTPINSAMNSRRSSLEDINMDTVDNNDDACLPPSYDEALAKLNTKNHSLPNLTESSSTFLNVPSTSRDDI